MDGQKTDLRTSLPSQLNWYQSRKLKITSITLYFPASQNHNPTVKWRLLDGFHRQIITDNQHKGEGWNSLAIKFSHVRTYIYEQNKLIFRLSILQLRIIDDCSTDLREILNTLKNFQINISSINFLSSSADE
jgi:hypothetical protein